MTHSRPLNTPALDIAQHPYRVYIEGIPQGSFTKLTVALDSARTLASIFEGTNRRKARWWVENTMNGTEVHAGNAGRDGVNDAETESHEIVAIKFASLYSGRGKNGATSYRDRPRFRRGHSRELTSPGSRRKPR